MTIKELFEKRARAWENAKDFLNTHQDENGLMSAEDSATYDKMEADIQAYTDQIERMQRQETMNAQMSAWNDNPMVTAPGAGTERPDARTGIASDNYAEDYNC